MLQAEGIWRAKVVLTGRPMEGSVLSLMRAHKHLGLLAFTFLVFSQHSGVGFFAVPLTNGMQAARVAICSAHSFSSSSIVAIDAMANEATTIQNTFSFLLLIFLCFSGFFFLGIVQLYVSHSTNLLIPSPFWSVSSFALGLGRVHGEQAWYLSASNSVHG